MYAGGSTGLATLRRDGFVSMDGTGTLTTPPVTFQGSHLFVNAEAGELAVEVLDESGFSAADCVPLPSSGTRRRVRWKERPSLEALTGKPVRFRFHLTNAKLYSFWVSPEPSGASHGFPAAGGPDLV